MLALVVLLALAQAEPASPPAESELDRAMREAGAAFGVGEAAPSSLPTVEPSKTEVSGYVSNRLTFGWINPTAPVPNLSDLPSVVDLFEANVQLRRPLWREAFAYADASIYLQTGGYFVELGPDGKRRTAKDRRAPSLKPQFVLSEGYVSYSPIENLNLLVGKKRIVWGPGLAFNPTDLLNPSKDPADPGLQRAGAVLGRLEVPTEHATFSFLAVPEVLYQENGLPYGFLNYPSYDRQDSHSHYLLAARTYLLLAETDLNLMYFFSNRFGDDFDHRSRVGLSFSRYFFTDYELHAELLLQEGTARKYVSGDCVSGGQASALGCLASGQSLFSASRMHDGRVYPRLLVGTRRVFSDESQLGVEYLWLADGYTPEQFRDFARGLSLMAQVPAGSPSPLTMGAQGGLVTRLAFEPMRRHYLFLTYSKPKIADDWTIGALILVGLEDLSGLISPSITWNALEWLNLQLSGFIPVRGLEVGQVEVYGRSLSEYSIFPVDWRVAFELKAFY